MSTTLSRPEAPAAAPAPTPPPPADVGTGRREDALMLATVAVMVTACLPLARVFVGLGFLRPVLGATLLALGLSWGTRRLGGGPLASLFVTIAGWIAFVSAAFFADTLAAVVLPTPATMDAAVTLWARGIELVQLRPAPVFAEAALVFIAVTGVWAVAYAVEGFVFRMAAPIRAILMALILWVVPLAVAPPTGRAWAWAVPFLAACALLLLSFAGYDLRRWGAWSPTYLGGRHGPERSLIPSGGLLAVVAIVAGALLAVVIPGFGAAPWYEVRGTGGTTLTTNPIVDIRSRLVAQDTGPVLRVTTNRPVYLRTTALDVYSESEEWTNRGIRGAPIRGTFPLEVPLGPIERVQLDVEVRNLPGAVLVPAPYQALNVDGPLADRFQYDTSNSTITLDAGATLEPGDTYALEAAIPAPTPEQLADAAVAPSPRLTALPPNVPEQVRQLAADVVEAADARTPFDQALAVQDELRSWEYSVEPPQGHGGQAMQSFITNRIGYCEQYAGTMAVMLRSLGIPARVAVGYTPGQPVDSDGTLYSITNAHAHAWVEVLFTDLGWVAFEPTPRSDGNVLVPSAANIAPARTVAQAGGETGEAEGQQPGVDGRAEDQLLRQNQQQEQTPEDDAEDAAAPGAAGDGTPGTRSPLWWALAALAAAAGVAAAVGLRGHTELPGRPPLQRVLHARTEVEHLARGVGMPPAPWETDREFLTRVAHRHGAAALDAADVLARQVGRARYATMLDEQAATAAESAAGRLQVEMLRERSRPGRAWVRLRGRSAGGAAGVRSRAAQRWSSSRRRAASR